MATKTFEELKQLAIQIRDEKTNKQNTATRVGTAMLEHINKLEQDYYDKTQTDEELKERDDKLIELENKTQSDILLLSDKIQKRKVTPIKGKYVDYNTGVETWNSGYEITGLMPIKPSTSYSTNVKITQVAGIAFYDENQEYISGTLQKDFTSPENAEFANITNDVTNIIEYIEVTDNTGLVQEVEQIKGDLLNLQDTSEFVDRNLIYKKEITPTKGRYVAYNTGQVYWNPNYDLAEKIPILPNRSYSTNAKITQQAGVAFYDADEQYISGTLNNDFITPPNAAFASISNDITNAIEYIEVTDNDGIIPSVERLKDIDPIAIVLSNAFSAFRKFGVISDSLGVGHNTNPFNQEVKYRDIYNSWGQVIARRYGTVCLNFGRSGATTKSWYTDPYCYTEFVKVDNLCQCYIMAIGTNDSEEIGSINDIDWANKDNNLDTFYGNYAKIIQKTNEVAPNAIVFCCTIPYPRNDVSKNNAIRDICNNKNVKNTYLVDLAEKYDTYFKSNYINGYYYLGHYNAAGYALYAEIVMTALNYVMNIHNSDNIMRNISNIPFGENNVIA